MATRYGSLKQLEPFGPHGETILDYSVYDAAKAGFGKVVFVIRKSIEAEFRKATARKYGGSITVEHVLQDLHALPAGFTLPDNREKPWGTGHAVWTAASIIKEPFAIINGDDFYGRQSFQLMADFLKATPPDRQYGLVGFQLKNTLSPHGAVSRGICEIDDSDNLVSVTEQTHLVQSGKGIVARTTDEQEVLFIGEEMVSMNLIGFTPDVFPYFETYFKEFLTTHPHDLKAEFYLPDVLNSLVQSREAQVKVLLSSEKWFGVTYPDDKAVVIRNIHTLISAGVYPENLWPQPQHNLQNKMAPGKEAAYNLHLIAEQFAIKGEAADIKPHGSGYIHDTFHVVNKQPVSPDYLLQRVNHQVFKNVPALMGNIQLVTTHLRKKLAAIPGANPDTEVLRLVPLKDGQLFYQDAAGNYWRMYEFLPHTRSYDIVHTAQQAYEGGKAFGTFQALLADMDANLLHETIPDFHNIAYRLRLFREAIARNPENRVKEVPDEIAFVEARAEVMTSILKLGQAGELPLRITHNDTKFNNVLLNEQDEAQCVIDLDTVMPGYVAYDFGDAIRTTVNTASEDEKDIEKISVNMDLFEAFTRGFLKETAGFLTNTEIRSLAMGCLLLPFIMGLRFLTDYIDGDTYYKINFPGHNIQRSRAQFRLVQKLEEQYDLLQSTIQDIANASKQEIRR